jgi:hypothetical protein
MINGLLEQRVVLCGASTAYARVRRATNRNERLYDEEETDHGFDENL